MEEGLLLEDHTGQHASQAPHVQAVVVHLHRGQGTGGHGRHFVRPPCSGVPKRWAVRKSRGAVGLCDNHKSLIIAIHTQISKRL